MMPVKKTRGDSLLSMALVSGSITAYETKKIVRVLLKSCFPVMPSSASMLTARALPMLVRSRNDSKYLEVQFSRGDIV